MCTFAVVIDDLASKPLTVEGGSSISVDAPTSKTIDFQRGLKFDQYTHILAVMADGPDPDTLTSAAAEIVLAITDYDESESQEPKETEWSRGTLSPHTATSYSPNDPDCVAVLFYVGFNMLDCPLDDGDDLEDLLVGRVIRALGDQFIETGIGVEMSLFTTEEAQAITGQGEDLEPTAQVFIS